MSVSVYNQAPTDRGIVCIRLLESFLNNYTGKTMKLIVAGSRNFNNYNLLRDSIFNNYKV